MGIGYHELRFPRSQGLKECNGCPDGFCSEIPRTAFEHHFPEGTRSTGTEWTAQQGSYV